MGGGRAPAPSLAHGMRGGMCFSARHGRRTCISTSDTVVRSPANGTYAPAPTSNCSAASGSRVGGLILALCGDAEQSQSLRGNAAAHAWRPHLQLRDADSRSVGLEDPAAQRRRVSQRHRQRQAHALLAILPLKLRLVRPAWGARHEAWALRVGAGQPHAAAPTHSLSPVRAHPAAQRAATSLVSAVLALKGAHDDLAEAGYVARLQLGVALQMRDGRRQSLGSAKAHAGSPAAAGGRWQVGGALTMP